MAGFLYYKSTSAQPVSMTEVRSSGLAYAFDDTPVSRAVTCDGPGGGRGLVFVRKDFPTAKHGYFPAHQQWMQMDLNRDVWVGWFKEDRPSPSDLLRADALTGRDVTLGDGNSWLAPVARSIVDDGGDPCVTVGLPQSLRREDGNWVAGSVVSKYADLWGIAQEVWDAFHFAFHSGTTTSFEIPDADYATACLQANYYLGVDEVSALELFRTNSMDLWQVLRVLIDVDSYMEFLKKKSEDLTAGCSSSDGQEDSIDTTHQPSRT